METESRLGLLKNGEVGRWEAGESVIAQEYEVSF